MRTVKPIDVYNLMNDLRHLVILDCRAHPDFMLPHSLHISQPDLAQQIKAQEQKSIVFEQSYDYPPIRRLVVIWDTPQELPIPLNGYDKVMLLGEPNQFKTKYPFLCLQEGDSPEKELFAKSRFPAEVLSDKVYVGSVFNALNKRQMECLGIDCVVDLTVYDQQVDRNKFPCGQYLNVPVAKEDVSAVVDLDGLCGWAAGWVDQNNKVMVVCLDGDGYAPAVAIALIKYIKKEQPMQLISMSVFQRRGTVKVDKALFGKVLEYTPNYGPQK